MTSNVLPPFSAKVTVVTEPSSLSSLVQTRRECGVTSLYVPKNAAVESPCANSKRYMPPTRTSISQESRDIPIDFATHHCLKGSGLLHPPALRPHHRLESSALVHASNTMRAGASKVRVTTTSRSDFRSAVVTFFM